jgi:hypothetical protein
MPGTTNTAKTLFDRWIETFPGQAMAHGITDETPIRVMREVRPDAAGLNEIRDQAELGEKPGKMAMDSAGSHAVGELHPLACAGL